MFILEFATQEELDNFVEEREVIKEELNRVKVQQETFKNYFTLLLGVVSGQVSLENAKATLGIE